MSGYDTSVLYHNEGGGRFREVADRGRACTGRLWGCSATFLDYDRDGRPDLFVSNYLEFDPEKPGRYPCRMYDELPVLLDREVHGPAELAVPATAATAPSRT